MSFYHVNSIESCAMIAVGQTIAGAVSGETANYAAPKGSQSQAKGQKSNKKLFLLFCHFEIGEVQSLFIWVGFMFIVSQES